MSFCLFFGTSIGRDRTGLLYLPTAADVEQCDPPGTLDWLNASVPSRLFFVNLSGVQGSVVSNAFARILLIPVNLREIWGSERELLSQTKLQGPIAL